MQPEWNNAVFSLYFLARGGGEPMINDVQKEAIRQLSDRAVQGDRQAREALIRLWHVPGYHILLKEMIGAVAGKPDLIIS
jgi:hypothetical protein